MSELLRFETREAFREWLSENCRRREGGWLGFGKRRWKHCPQTMLYWRHFALAGLTA